MEKFTFKKGIFDGLPICFGYFAVSFAFGIFAFGSGLDLFQCFMVSATNVTSAGQFAAVPIMTGTGSLIEIAAGQLVINLRYSLMSVSLSQKLDSSMGTVQRLIVAFVNTDEVFAVASSKEGKLNKNYLYGLIITPWLGWSLGTFLGAMAGDILPRVVTNALSLAIYAMFVAIVVPPAKKDFGVLICSFIAIAASCCFKYIKLLSSVPSGFVIIICAVIAAAVMAAVRPVEE